MLIGIPMLCHIFCKLGSTTIEPINLPLDTARAMVHLPDHGPSFTGSLGIYHQDYGWLRFTADMTMVGREGPSYKLLKKP